MACKGRESFRDKRKEREKEEFKTKEIDIVTE
jgi:hypothetical protein